MVLQPEAVDMERSGSTVQFGIQTSYQPITVEDWESVITPTALSGRLVDLPNVFEIEQPVGTSARADDIERGQEGSFRFSRRLERLPSLGYFSTVDGFDQWEIAGQCEPTFF